MLKHGVLIAVAVVSLFPTGCSERSVRVVHRCRLASFDLRIIREKETLENPHLYYELIGPGGVVKHSTYLATEATRSYTFSSVVDSQAGIAVIVESRRPCVFIAAFDLNTLQPWPDRDKPPEAMREMEDRVGRQMERLTGRAGWSGGGIVTSDPVSFP